MVQKRAFQGNSKSTWNDLFFVRNDTKNEYSVDSFPISCCEKSRIDKRKIFVRKEYIGYAASKKRYFCGVKVHMVVTSDGKPIEFEFRAGSESDLKYELFIWDDTQLKLF